MTSVTVGASLEWFKVLADLFDLCAFGGRELERKGHEGALFHFEVSPMWIRVFGYENVGVHGVPITPVADIEDCVVGVFWGRFDCDFGVYGPGAAFGKGRGWARAEVGIGAEMVILVGGAGGHAVCLCRLQD